MGFHFYAEDSRLYFSFDSHSVEEKSFAVAQTEACVRYIDFWMRVDKLKTELNSDNSEVFIIRKNLSVY